MWTRPGQLLFYIAVVTSLIAVCLAAAAPRDVSKLAVHEVPPVAEADTDDADAGCECTSVYDFEMALLTPRQTSLVPPVKQEKPPRPLWKPSRRQGLRRVWATFYNVHSDEAVPVLEHRLPPDEVFDDLFKCRGFGKTKRIDPRLVEAAVAAARHFKSDRVEVISGYRSPKFNDALAKKGRYVATESKHTKGQALDIRVVGAKAKAVGNWLFEHFDGGVGTYQSDDFVHIDVGPKRRWQGR